MFSVVIPLYNKENYINRAIDSVLAQEFENFELIVVDDGSTDKSLDKIKFVSDPRLKVIKQLNQGVGLARNKGITESKYEWIAFLDADDAWSEDHLSELSNIVRTFPDSHMVSTRTLQVKDSNKLPISTNTKFSNIRSIDYFYESSKVNGVISSSSVAISKRVFKEIGGFSNKKIGEDIEYWVKIALSYPVAISERVTTYYFRDTNGVMQAYVKSIKEKPMMKKYSLYDISPAISFILKESQNDPDILKRSNIRLYINTTLLDIVKASILDNNFCKAHDISKLALPQLDRQYIYMTLYKSTPNFFLKKVFSFYKRIK